MEVGRISDPISAGRQGAPKDGQQAKAGQVEEEPGLTLMQRFLKLGKRCLGALGKSSPPEPNPEAAKPLLLDVSRGGGLSAVHQHPAEASLEGLQRLPQP